MTREPASIAEVAPGVWRIHRASVNCYLVYATDGLTLVDAGLPGMWAMLLETLDRVGASPADLSGIVLTHAHFDHVGLAHRLGRQHGVASHVHPLDRELASHPYRYRPESPRGTYPFRHPGGIPILAAMAAAGALTVKGVVARDDLRPGEPLDLPGGLVPVFTPGHTDGHCALAMPRSGIVFSGDALVTIDPYTGRTGPRVVARAATADAERGFASLDAIAQTDAAIVLPGHGAPFDGGALRAAEEARSAGIA